LDWNAYYEAFAVHARVLLDFLENKSDARNFRKSDFSGTFKAETDQEIQRIVRQEMNCQVFHFGKSRKSEPSGKVDLEKVNRVHKWVMDNFSRFLAELDDDLKGHWDPDRANPEKFHENSPMRARYCLWGNKIRLLRQAIQWACNSIQHRQSGDRSGL